MNATLLDSGPADPVASSAAANAAVPTAPPLVQPEISAATMAPNAVALTASTQAAAAESNAASAETSTPAAGVDQVRVPGDTERESAAARSAEGIPIDENSWNGILKAAEVAGVGTAEIAAVTGDD